jgi:hypothetical protein
VANATSSAQCFLHHTDTHIYILSLALALLIHNKQQWASHRYSGWYVGPGLGLQVLEHNRGKCHFFSAAFPSQLETMVGGVLPRTSALHVDLGVGRTLIASGSHTRP